MQRKPKEQFEYRIPKLDIEKVHPNLTKKVAFITNLDKRKSEPPKPYKVVSNQNF